MTLSNLLPSVRGESPKVLLAVPKHAKGTLTSLSDKSLKSLFPWCLQTNRVTGVFETGYKHIYFQKDAYFHQTCKCY